MQKKSKIMMVALLAIMPSLVQAQSYTQSFLREPSHQTAVVGEHVTLACRVVNKHGVLQWTRDGFGLGSDRELTGFKRYKMTGSDEEGKET